MQWRWCKTILQWSDDVRGQWIVVARLVNENAHVKTFTTKNTVKSFRSRFGENPTQAFTRNQGFYGRNTWVASGKHTKTEALWWWRFRGLCLQYGWTYRCRSKRRLWTTWNYNSLQKGRLKCYGNWIANSRRIGLLVIFTLTWHFTNVN